MVKDLSVLLSPKSVAVIGASRSPEKVGAIVLKNIIDSKFTGKIYLVNPNAQTINDLPVIRDVNSLPEVVDLAVIALPAAQVLDTLTQIGDKGIKNVVVFSAGFREIGPEGEQLESAMAAIAQKYSLRILGPNCLGFVNNACPINATFGQPVKDPGPLRFISQSGAIAASLFDWCNSTSLGFSDFITLGNKTVLNENDFLEYFLGRPPADKPQPIGLYLESVSHGSEFIKIAGRIGKTNPVFILKPGKSAAAAVAMQSHTGAIAGEDSILDAALTQAGVIRCQTLEDFFDLSRAMAWENAPAGPKIAVISNAGGAAVISADAVVSSGLQLAEFDEDTKNKLHQVLPRSASLLNPVDVLGDALADRYASAAEIILQTNQADCLLVILTPQVMTQVTKTAQSIISLSKRFAKPIFCCFIGGQLVYEGEQILNQNRIPSFRFPERAIATIGAMWQWKKWQLQPAEIPVAPPDNLPPQSPDRINEIVTGAVKSNHPALDNLEADEVVSLLGIPTPPTAAVVTIEEAKNFAQEHGWPMVLKLSSPGLLHKATLGGVVTDIWNATQLESAWDRLSHNISQLPPPARDHIRFQIQKNVISGVEVIVGVKHDPTFGPVLLFGAGGQLAELVADKNLKILPVSYDQARQLVGQSKVFKLLQNHPGEPPYALDKLYDLIIRVTQLIPLIPQASDFEINPVIVTHNHVWAVDSKILLTGVATHPVTPPAFHTASLVNNTILAAKFRYLELESQDPLVYQPGQYISIKVAPNRINSYSIAGHTDEHKFQLLVDTSPGGPGSKFFENVAPGDKVAYLGPFGIFTLKPDDGAKRLLFFGTGSGCSPLRSILEAALKHPNLQAPVDFYFGLRHTSDVFWQDYFQKLSKDHPNFHFTISLSQPDAGWQGQVGHITELLEKEVPDASGCSAYLCGNPKMMEEATKILISHNCPKDRIYSESF